MTDFIKYRFPGENPVELNGSFKKISISDEFEGFVISDLTLEKLWGFVSDDSDQPASKLNTPVTINKLSYISDVTHLIDEMVQSGVDKVVFSRVKKFDLKIGPVDLFNQLMEVYPDAFVYLISGGDIGTWIGATPERLIEQTPKGNRIMSLAGTKLSEDNSDWGQKELKEHQYVTDQIRAKLKKLNIDFQEEPISEYSAGPVKHLLKNFYIPTSSSAWAVAKKIHPTPAIAGVPEKEAIDLIKQFENHDRGLYTGLIGLRGSITKVFVNLRCAQIFKDHLYMYVGGGLTKDSIPELEWEETENKSRTFSRLLKNQ